MTKTHTLPGFPARRSPRETGKGSVTVAGVTGFMLAGLVLAGLVFVAGPGRAEPVAGVPLGEIHEGLHTDGRTDFLAIIEALSNAGYDILSADVTLLNRVRIRADNGSHLREIVVSRASGRVLRDVVVETRLPAPPVPLEDLLEFLPDGTIRVREGGDQ